MRRLQCRPLDAAAFAPFGQLIDPAAREPESINDGSTARLADLARLDLRGPDRDPVLAIYVARARRFPLRIVELERHREAAQVFLPLGAQRFVVVVAGGGEVPDWSRLHAFVTQPGQGVSLHRGCWHHGLVALGDGDRFAVVEGGNYRSDTQRECTSEAIELLAPDRAAAGD
jgi:ureidoglycolate lyase